MTTTHATQRRLRGMRRYVAALADERRYEWTADCERAYQLERAELEELERLEREGKLKEEADLPW